MQEPQAEADARAPRGIDPFEQREVEWQFETVDTRLVEQWLSTHSRVQGVRLGEPQTRQLVDVYLDTDNWRLHKSGYSLRIREQDGAPEATLKSMDAPVAGVRNRSELTEHLSSTNAAGLKRTPGPVGDLIRALVGSRQLRPLFELRTTRKAYPLKVDRRAAGEVVLDDTRITLEGDEEPIRLHRVEVEADRSAPAALDGWVEQLRAACRLQPAVGSKYEAGLFARGLQPTADADLGPTAVRDEMSAGETAFAVLRRHFAAMLEHEAGTRLGTDPEELHDMRVATRRLRAAMRLFEDALPETAPRLREELGWVAHALGEVRDLDVQLEQLERWVDEATPEERDGLYALREVLEKRRTAARRSMLRVLDAKRYDRFASSMTTALQRGPAADQRDAERPILAVAPDLLEQRYDKFRRQGDALNPASAPEAYHELRIQGKKLRYALEFLGDVYGKPARATVAPLVRLQDVLGEHQDAYVAIERLHELSEAQDGQLPTRTVFAMGSIAHRYAERAAALRSAFPKTYKAVGGKDWRKLEKLIEKRRPPVPEPKPEPVDASDDVDDSDEPYSVEVMPVPTQATMPEDLPSGPAELAEPPAPPAAAPDEAQADLAPDQEQATEGAVPQAETPAAASAGADETTLPLEGAEHAAAGADEEAAVAPRRRRSQRRPAAATAADEGDAEPSGNGETPSAAEAEPRADTGVQQPAEETQTEAVTPETPPESAHAEERAG